MNQQEKKQLKALMVTTSLYYGREINDAVILMQVQDLEDLPFAEVAKAFNDYRKNPSNKGAPLPAMIRAMLCPEMSADQLALEASNKIIEAMARFGWTNLDKAREFMGEIAWGVVVREGGWAQLCERAKNDDLPILKAQWRELAKVVAIRLKQDKPSVPFLEGTKHKQLDVK